LILCIFERDDEGDAEQASHILFKLIG
jgi:hypothetical protein